MSPPDFDLAAQRARLSPTRAALLWRDSWLSYRDLDTRACALAGRLAEAGLERGDRVALLAPNHIAHLDLFLASAKLGVVAVPLDPRLAPAEVTALTRSVRPAALLHDAALGERVEAARAALLPRDDGELWSWSLAEYDAWLEGAPAPPAPPQLDPEETRAILFTSGSGGRPKGARIPYRQIAANAAATALSWGLREDDCALQATPCAHAGLHALTTPLLHAGGRVVLLERFEPAAYLEAVARQRATLIFLVPTMFKLLAEDRAFRHADLRSVRWAISGGAPLPGAIRELWSGSGVPLKQGYGLTEAGVNCFAISSESATLNPDAVGAPVIGTRAVVRHPDGRPCAAGETGELTLAGPHLFSGYDDDDVASAEALRGGWLWTGDLALCGDDGLVRICGRRREMYISGGLNVFPSEIEAALLEHTDVAACAVLGVADPHWGESGLAAVEPRLGRSPDLEALRAFLRERLAGYKIPRHLLLLEALPLTASGKVAKHALRAAFEQRAPQRRTPDAAP